MNTCHHIPPPFYFNGCEPQGKLYYTILSLSIAVVVALAAIMELITPGGFLFIVPGALAWLMLMLSVSWLWHGTFHRDKRKCPEWRRWYICKNCGKELKDV